MTNIKRLALAALAAFGLTARGAVETNDWWEVDFTSPTPATEVTGYGNVDISGSVVGLFTNEWEHQTQQQPYQSGYWTALEGDDSYVTNGIVTNVVAGVATENTSWHLELDTQGNDLLWTPTGTVENVIALVDADIRLVGSETEPDSSEFDSTNTPVHTAIYLKNFIDTEDTGDVTNSLLCVYVFDSSLGSNVWQELDGVAITNETWHHVQVQVDYSGASPMVKVAVDGTPMHARDDASKTAWPAANQEEAIDAGKLTSVAFRGTGSVDNFVGTTRREYFETLTFAAEVYMDGVLQAEGSTGNTTRHERAEAGDPGSGKTVTFRDFLLSDYDYENFETNATWAVDKIEFVNPVDGSVASTYFTWDAASQTAETNTYNGNINIATDKDYGYQTGAFNVTASTDGAVDPTNTVVKIYFKTIGAYDGYATTTDDTTTTTNAVIVKPSDFAEGATKTLTWDFPAVSGGNILSTVVATNGATFVYNTATSNATVSVTLNAALAADTVFAAAVYTNGTLSASQTLEPDAGVNGLYTFSVVDSTPPAEEHAGAKSDNGFVILDPTDTAAEGKQLEFTDFDPSAGTATIEAAILNPNGETSVTLQLIYRTSLTGSDQYVDATISDIDTTAGTATVTFTMPDEDTLFLMGFRNKPGIVDAEP